MSKNKKIKGPIQLKVIQTNRKSYKDALEEIENYRHKLAESKLDKISIILQYKYGFENFTGYAPEEKEYVIYIEEYYWEPYYPEGANYYVFPQLRLLENDIEEIAYDLAKVIWSTLPISQGSINL